MSATSLRDCGNRADYVAGYCYVEWYVEWYGDDNGRVVVELDARPGAESSAGRSRLARASRSRVEQQSRNMANFLAGISRAMAVPAIAPGQHLVSDPSFTHWVVADGP
jgi:hypothetical protein